LADAKRVTKEKKKKRGRPQKRGAVSSEEEHDDSSNDDVDKLDPSLYEIQDCIKVAM